MFLRRNRRTVNGECYEYWTLVKTVRTAKGPRQEIVATLGKEPGLESRTRHGWEQVGDLLEGRTPGPVQGELGQPVPAALQPHWAQVDLSGVRVERVRDFGQMYLGLSLWRRLGLHTLLREIIEPGQDSAHTVGSAVIALASRRANSSVAAKPARLASPTAPTASKSAAHSRDSSFVMTSEPTSG